MLCDCDLFTFVPLGETFFAIIKIVVGLQSVFVFFDLRMKLQFIFPFDILF